MQNYFGPFYFGELKPYNSKYCSNFVLFFGLQLIFAPFKFVVLFGTRNSRNKGHANIKGFTVITQQHVGVTVNEMSENTQLRTSTTRVGQHTESHYSTLCLHLGSMKLTVAISNFHLYT